MEIGKSIGDLMAMDVGDLIEATWPSEEERYRTSSRLNPFDGPVPELDDAEEEWEKENRSAI